MELHAANIIRLSDLVEPALVIESLPPSDNKRKTRNRYTGQVVTDGRVGVFKGHVKAALLASKFQVPDPPCVIVYKAYFIGGKGSGKRGRKGDVGNVGKALVDALFKEDKDVLAWPVFHGITKENPRVEIWFASISKTENLPA